MVGERSDESWKKVVGFPPLAAIISLAIADCEALQETSAAGHMIQTPANVHLHATDPPTVRPPLIIYILPNSKMYGCMAQSRRPNGRQLF